MIPKFRFWYEREDFYPDENYMRHVWGIEYITDSKIKLNDDYIFNPYTNVAENIYAKTKIYLMQYTGLKDQNGVEIFEGDILRLTLNDYAELEKPYIFTVSSDEEYYGDVLYLQNINYHINQDDTRDSIEIIGNIYENPELLEVAE